MKKLLSIILATLMIMTTVSFALAAEEGNVVILYTNDVHCAIDSYPALAAYRAELISQGNTVITLDAGDAIQGEIIGTFTQGEAIVNIMNEVGYDYAVPGNHEYDYGMEAFLNLAKNKAEYNYVSSNFYKLSSVKPVFKPYYIENISEDMQIAFVGISTPESVTKSSPDHFKDEYGNFMYGFPTFDMQDDILCETIQESVDNAIADGADIVVAVGHLGIEGITEGWKSTDIIAHTTGIDLFIDSHAHQTIISEVYKNKDGENVTLTSSGTKLDRFGAITFSDDGNVSFELINPDAIEIETLSESAVAAYNDVKQLVDSYNAEISYLYDPIGSSEVKLTAYDEYGQWLVRKSETNLGDFVTDAYRIMTGADVAVCNSGGIRSEIEIGSVSRLDLMNINPWNKEMYVVEITGQQLIDLLEHSVHSYPEHSGAFLQVSGVTFDVEAWRESPVVTDSYGNFIRVDTTLERRVKNVRIAGNPIVLDKTYSLASSKYVIEEGGDGFVMLQGSKILQKEGLPCDSDMLINYFNDILGGDISAEQYRNPYGDGRINIIDIELMPDDTEDEDTENDDTTDVCKHICHKTGFLGILWKVICFFSKIFNLSPVCECGIAHY